MSRADDAESASVSPLRNASFLSRASMSMERHDDWTPKGREDKWLAIETKKHAVAMSTASNDYLYSLANDPSVAQHLIEKNVRKAVPSMLEKADEARDIATQAKAMHEDVSFTVKSLDNVCDTPVFKSVHSKLFCATEFAKQLLSELETADLHAQAPAAPSQDGDEPGVAAVAHR
eukprot:TRINITY_DN5325_c0_g1_i1.p1 TRINITY_DN5325_c0_g1~~TRINITY_DN5325_c0_g1_i1.p1  ORF type:complete len:175 (+),score=60.97 TRINITY_DN5325_c0_g1_i1:62-586(+)